MRNLRFHIPRDYQQHYACYFEGHECQITLSLQFEKRQENSVNVVKKYDSWQVNVINSFWCFWELFDPNFHDLI